MKRITQLRSQIAEILAALTATTNKAEAENRSFTPDETKANADGLAKVTALKAEIVQLEAIESEQRSAATPAAPKHTPAAIGDSPEDPAPKKEGPGITTLPATARRSGPVKSFAGPNADLKAYRFGVFAAASLGSKWAQKRAREIGIELRVHSEGDDNAGGVWVPDEFSTDAIDLREKYGVFRQYSGIKTMTRDTLSIPRRTGGLTAYFVGESDAITQSTKTWNKVQLVAKKLAVITKATNELNEDSIINIGDDIFGEINYAFANKEDECGFNGDGTSTYGGITGVLPKIKGLSSTIADIAGLVVGSGNAYSELVLADFEAVVAKLPEYADTQSARWFTHRTFFYNVMVKLALAAGGVTKEEIVNGQRAPIFLGYPVVFSQVLPKVEANSQVCTILGDLALASKFGDRRQTTIAMSDSALNAFEQDEIVIRGTERFDVVVHDVGNQSATAASRVPGPIVGLITAAS